MPSGSPSRPSSTLLGADVVVLEPACLFLGEDDDVPGFVGEAFEHAFRFRSPHKHVNTMLLIRYDDGRRQEDGMDWKDRLDAVGDRAWSWARSSKGPDWVTLERAATETGVSRAALRTW